MANLTGEERRDLLLDLTRMGSNGRAEGESLDTLRKTFHPVQEHMKMMDPQVVLVVGPRGSGKTEIFLRTDLYDRHATRGGADLAELAAGRVELRWSERQIYGMLLRRLANASPRLAEYVCSVPGKVEWEEDDDLGMLAKLYRWEDARGVIERMMGPHMGTSCSPTWWRSGFFASASTGASKRPISSSTDSASSARAGSVWGEAPGRCRVRPLSRRGTRPPARAFGPSRRGRGPGRRRGGPRRTCLPRRRPRGGA